MVGKRSGRTAPGRYSLAVLYGAVAAELETLLSIDGVIIQDKWASISVHYNTTQQPSTAKQQILIFWKVAPHQKLRLMDEKTNIASCRAWISIRAPPSPVLFSNTISGEQSISG